MLQESWTTLQPSERCLHNINVFCSVRKSQKELVSVYLWGLLCQLLDEFAAVEAAVEVSPQ